MKTAFVEPNHADETGVLFAPTPGACNCPASGICLALWAQFTLPTWRSEELSVQARQIHLGLVLFFPWMLAISVSHASWVLCPNCWSGWNCC